jgi:hypothetical protein
MAKRNLKNLLKVEMENKRLPELYAHYSERDKGVFDFYYHDDTHVYGIHDGKVVKGKINYKLRSTVIGGCRIPLDELDYPDHVPYTDWVIPDMHPSMHTYTPSLEKMVKKMEYATNSKTALTMHHVELPILMEALSERIRELNHANELPEPFTRYQGEIIHKDTPQPKPRHKPMPTPVPLPDPEPETTDPNPEDLTEDFLVSMFTAASEKYENKEPIKNQQYVIKKIGDE